MRMITKGSEPTSLATHRSQDYSDYNNYPEKDELRHALVTEQRGLCCYCMSRIGPTRSAMKVEHWRCQSRYQDEQLDYRNLLASCLGGEGQPPHFQHCDTKKGNRDLKWNPAEWEHQIETRIRYERNGSIRSDEADFDSQLESVLNLNLPLLRNRRKAVYDGFLEWWQEKRGSYQGAALRNRLERERARYDDDVTALEPHAPVTIWLLRHKLSQIAA